jgi:hypothetical protein
MAAVARALGHDPMPHQKLVFDVAGEFDPATGVPVYREVGCTEPRQSGKTFKVLVRACWRLAVYPHIRGRPQRLAYSAQSGFDARRKMMDDWLPVLEQSALYNAVGRVRRASGHEAFIMRDGSMLTAIANNVAAGHGKTLDEGYLDEAFDDVDNRREQAMVPAMATRDDAQLWVTSTAGDQGSIFLRRKVDTYRALVDAGVDSGTCYFEWSADDEVDLDDESLWPSFMPALGQTIDVATVRHARQTMTDTDFARAFANRWPAADATLIPWGDWLACRSDDAAPEGQLYLAVDAPPERTHAVIVAASFDAEVAVAQVEVVDRRRGLAWVVDRAAELYRRHDVQRICVAGSGPAGSLIPDLERAGLPVEVVNDVELTRAAGATFDAIVERRLSVRPDDRLDDAVAGARKRARGDAFAWARTHRGVDLSPLVAASLAVWSAKTDVGGALWLYR